MQACKMQSLDSEPKLNKGKILALPRLLKFQVHILQFNLDYISAYIELSLSVPGERWEQLHVIKMDR